MPDRYIYSYLFLLLWIPGILRAGDTAYVHAYGGPNIDHCKEMQATNDNGYVLIGSTSSYGNGNSDIYLVKVDSSGAYQWSKTYGGANIEWGYSIKQTYDNGYAIAGYTNSYGAGGYDVYLLKTDSLGGVL